MTIQHRANAVPSARHGQLQEVLELTLLIMSDIHFGSFAEYAAFAPAGYPLRKPTFGAKDVLGSLIDAIRQLGKPVDAILVPGDLTSTATPAEFVGCATIVSRIASEIGCPVDAIFYTFGNHDANWTISKIGDPNPPLPGDNGYHSVAANIANLFVRNPVAAYPGPVLGTGVFDTPKFRLFVLNSGYYCIHDQEFSHGKIGPEQLQWIEDALMNHTSTDKWNLMMLHHHPFNYSYPTAWHDVSTLEEGPQLTDLIGRAPIDMVFHGHRHHPTHKTSASIH